MLPSYQRLATTLGLQPIKFVGKGAAGHAYLCKKDDAEVVLKITPIERNTSRLVRAELNAYKVLDAHAQFQHTENHVLHCYKAGVQDGLAYFVTEYCPEGTLLKYIEISQNRRIDEEICKTIVKQVTKAVCFLHSIGIVHRDIKPENIFIKSLSPLEIKLADFDRSILVRPCYENGKDVKINEIDGSPYFMSPEALFNHEFSANCDTYSIGMCLFDMLSGETKLGFSINEMDDLVLLHKKFAAGDVLLDQHSQYLSSDCISALRGLLCNASTRLYPKDLLMHSWLSDSQTSPIITPAPETPSLPPTPAPAPAIVAEQSQSESNDASSPSDNNTTIITAAVKQSSSPLIPCVSTSSATKQRNKSKSPQQTSQSPSPDLISSTCPSEQNSDSNAIGNSSQSSKRPKSQAPPANNNNNSNNNTSPDNQNSQNVNRNNSPQPTLPSDKEASSRV